MAYVAQWNRFNPSSFSNTDIFIIQTGQTVTTTGNWNISGTNAKIIIEANATLMANDKVVVDKFEADAGATFVHNDNSNTFPGDVERTLAATSTVKITDWNGSAKLPSPTTWGNLTIDLDGYGNNINQAGSLTDIAGNFTIMETGQEFRLATGQDYTLTIGGNLIIQDGTLEASSSNSAASQTIIVNGSYINQEEPLPVLTTNWILSKFNSMALPAVSPKPEERLTQRT